MRFLYILYLLFWGPTFYKMLHDGKKSKALDCWNADIWRFTGGTWQLLPCIYMYAVYIICYSILFKLSLILLDLTHKRKGPDALSLLKRIFGIKECCIKFFQCDCHGSSTPNSNCLWVNRFNFYHIATSQRVISAFCVTLHISFRLHVRISISPSLSNTWYYWARLFEVLQILSNLLIQSNDNILVAYCQANKVS